MLEKLTCQVVPVGRPTVEEEAALAPRSKTSLRTWMNAATGLLPTDGRYRLRVLDDSNGNNASHSEVRIQLAKKDAVPDPNPRRNASRGMNYHD
jgi:hypothetical protein